MSLCPSKLRKSVSKVDTSTLPSKSDIPRKKKPKVRSREDLATTSQNALRKITNGTFQRASTIQIHDWERWRAHLPRMWWRRGDDRACSLPLPSPGEDATADIWGATNNGSNDKTTRDVQEVATIPLWRVASRLQPAITLTNPVKWDGTRNRQLCTTGALVQKRTQPVSPPPKLQSVSSKASQNLSLWKTPVEMSRLGASLTDCKYWYKLS